MYRRQIWPGTSVAVPRWRISVFRTANNLLPDKAAPIGRVKYPENFTRKIPSGMLFICSINVQGVVYALQSSTPIGTYYPEELVNLNRFILCVVSCRIRRVGNI